MKALIYNVITGTKTWLLCCAALLTITATAQWVTNGPTGTNGTTYAIVTIGANTFAGLDGGGVFLSTNYGSSWTAVNSGLIYQTVMSMTANGSNLFAGTNGSMYLSTNNGTSWSAVNTGLGSTSLVCYSLATNGNYIFAGIEGNGVYASSNNGASWTSANTGLGTIFPTSITAVDTNVYVASQYGGVYISHNNGASWTTPAATGLNGVGINAILVQGSSIFVATQAKGVFVSTDNGATFTAVNTGLPNNYIAYSLVANGSSIFVGGEQGTLYQSGNNGASWTSIGSGLPTGNYISALGINGTELFAGTYGLNVWQRSLACTATAPALTSAGTSICTGDSIQICATSGYKSYSWNTGATSNCVEAKLAGKYYVSVTDNNNCTAVSDTVTTTVIAPPVATITATQNSFCTGDSTQICVAGTFSSYHWNTNATTTCIYAKQTGNYYLVVTDNNSCTAQSNQIGITVHSAPVDSITASVTVFCSSDSATICAVGGFSTYQWNQPGIPGNSCISVTAAGNYYVTVTDNNGCSAESNHLSISVYPVPSVSIIVQGDTLSSFGAVSYHWYLNNDSILGATGQVYVALQPGSYSVQVVDTNGCTTTSTPVTVTGIENLTQQNISVFPNPSSAASWHLSIPVDLVGSQLQVLDADGRLVFNSELRTQNSKLDLNVAPGIYWLHITNTTVNITRKLVKL